MPVAVIGMFVEYLFMRMTKINICLTELISVQIFFEKIAIYT